jgi:cell division protein FtsN
MGTPQWIALGASALVILGLTFTLGALVGRQWARHSQPTLVADPARKVAPATRRSGLTEGASAQPPAAQEKLTFYKTLTAPLETTPFSAKPDTPAKPTAPSKSQAPPARVVGPGNDRVLPPRAEEHPPAGSSTARTADQPDLAERPHAASAEWTVQVGVFGSAQQAVSVKRGLDQKGFEAHIAPMSSGDGQIRYRVRIGTFHSREEALREAERVRSERSLPTFVTAK